MTYLLRNVEEAGEITGAASVEKTADGLVITPEKAKVIVTF